MFPNYLALDLSSFLSCTQCPSCGEEKREEEAGGQRGEEALTHFTCPANPKALLSRYRWFSGSAHEPGAAAPRESHSRILSGLPHSWPGLENGTRAETTIMDFLHA